MAFLRCVSAAVGAAALFASAAARHDGNPCDDEDDGWQCHDDAVVQCEGGRTVSHQYCEFYQDCREGLQGLGSASCEEDVCEDKFDGLYCEDDHVVECRGLKTVNSTLCPFYEECKRNSTNATHAFCQEDTCDTKRDGMYCEDDHVVECRSQLTVNATKCGLGQDCHDEEYGLTPTAQCYDDCHQKVDGQHRKQAGVLDCLSGKTVAFTACAPYQVSSEGTGNTVSCEEEACSSRQDGWHCFQDSMVVRCADAMTVEAQQCPTFTACKQSGDSQPACV